MKRDSNLELLRIISMCGIILLHYLGMGGALQEIVFPSFSWFFNSLVGGFCVPLVNCFVLITGYFLIGKNTFSLRKPMELLIITAFYGILSLLIAALRGTVELSAVGFAEAIFPFIQGRRWFVETYIILILFAPFLNLLLLQLTREHYRLLLAVQLGLFCVWYSIGLSAPVLDDGYGITNFVTLYLLGGYIRLYGADFDRVSRRSWAILYTGCALATFVLSYFINPFGYAFFSNILGAVALFLCFLKWDIGVCPGINCISAVAFDVYFVHSDFNTSHLLFSGLLGSHFVADTPWMIPRLLLVLPAVWVLGYTLCALRKRLFSRTVDRLLDRCTVLNQKADLHTSTESR